MTDLGFGGAAMFRRVLVANRGEIALRVIRALRDHQIEAVAVYTDVDRDAPHVRAADFAFSLGSADSGIGYLDHAAVLDVAVRAKVCAIHPGYGFLSENPEFAEGAVQRGMVFIGPPAHAMRVMGSKTAARKAMIAAAVPVVPGSPGPVTSLDEARAEASKIGYPVLLKAAAGGGGKGMRFVNGEAELESGLRAAQSEALSAFGDDEVYIEKALIGPRHIEIQVFSGADGQTIWLGERECSLQRRHQKVIEETPSPVVDEALRRRLGEVAVCAARAVDYVGAGTVEFLLADDGEFYFLEMNTRLQVEHPVTEMCCGVDLVGWQLVVAAGGCLPLSQADVQRRGHAIEARLYAEDPELGFLPSPGKITHLVLPSGPGVRVDSGVVAGSEVSIYYDPMLAKIFAWGTDRDQAIRRLRRALLETTVAGITTNLSLLRRLLSTEEFTGGDYHTGVVEDLLGRGSEDEASPQAVEVALVTAAIRRFENDLRAAKGEHSDDTGIDQQKSSVAQTASLAWRNGLCGASRPRRVGY